MSTRFGKLLRYHRKLSGLSQEELKDKIDNWGNHYDKSAISKWETGLHVPPAEIVEILEDILLPSLNGLLLKAAGYHYQAEDSDKSNANSKHPSIETQFTVPGGEVHRQNIYANKGQVIKGSWKSNGAIYRWWTSPYGAAYPLEDYGTGLRITGIFEPTLIDPEPGFWMEGNRVVHSMVGLLGGDIDIVCDIPYRESGYYTLCFMPFPYSTTESVNITVSYRLE